ncbi:MAG: class I SAM-dependent methyltransferase [Nitrospirota bacterium]|nr:class I SAM-dependent methyltransferase [Nitrospirota bacterium]
MDARSYDDWYKTSRGRWIGRTEYRLLRNALGARPGTTLLDVGCGTGFFTRLFAEDGFETVGIDPDPGYLTLAKSRQKNQGMYLQGDVRSLPFRNRSFDFAVAVTSLCFVSEMSLALSEMARVTRNRFALGLLNRQSLLFREKWEKGGYKGARWDTAGEVRTMISDLATGIDVKSAIFFPSGTFVSRTLERVIPPNLLYGGFLVISARPK